MRFTLRFAQPKLPTFSGNARSFTNLKASVAARSREEFKKLKQNSARVEQFDLPGGGFALRTSGLSTQPGRTRMLLQVWTPNPVQPTYPAYLSMTAPTESFPKYLGLAGLILRDRRVSWPREAGGSDEFSLASFRAMGSEARAFEQAANEAIALVKTGRVHAFLSKFTDPQKRGVPGVAKWLREDIIPFFKLNAGPAVETMVSRDGGREFPTYSFGRSVRTGKREALYVIRIEKQGTRFIVAGIDLIS